jgi:hypothetical protein
MIDNIRVLKSSSKQLLKNSSLRLMVLLLTAVTITLHKNAIVDTIGPHDTNYRLCGFSIALIFFMLSHLG